VGLSIGQFLNWQLISKRLRIYTEVANDSITIPAYLENRFNDKTKILRLVTAIVIVIFFTFYTASGLVSGGLLFSSAFHISYTTALIISSVIVVSYTCIGGFLAVSWIDFFQGCLMFFALLIIPAVTLHALHGLDNTMDIIRNYTTPGYLDAFSGISTIGILSLLSWGLGYFGQPHILVRFMAMRTHREAPKAQFICMSWMNLSLYGAVFTGLFGMAFFAKSPLKDPETNFIHLSTLLFNPWISGALLAAVLSATMSTSSSQLLASSSAIAEDFYRRFFRPKASAKELIIIARLGMLFIAVIAFAMALNTNNSILHLVSHAWAGLGGAFGPVILISLFWKRMNLQGSIAGIITGTVVIFIWSYFKHLGGIFSLYELIPAFLFNCITIFVVSSLTKQPDESVLKDFEQTQLLLKSDKT
ncbi:MAG: sodium/proline symporter PutP, partial [Endozoicomonadaceae bacterium]|nr:sodium/proline symporter PutP [Endozoicomonadaceae bacterium]